MQFNNGDRVFQSAHYQLVFHANRPFVSVKTAEGVLLTELFVFSGVHPLHGRDDTYRTGEWASQETATGIEFSITAWSNIWQSKTYRFHCEPGRFTYHIEVEGEGFLADVLYFGGYSSESKKWGSGFFWSGQRFSQIFNPEPNVPEVFYHPSAAGTKIDLMGVPLPARGDWFFTPPPFCFAGQYTENGWLALGVEARPGHNTFTEYHYHGSYQAFYLSLSYEGYTRVQGRYELPAIGFDFADDEYAAVAAHVTALRTAGYVPLPEPRPKPAWWYSPIFCGWGAQSYLAALENGRTADYARQQLYEEFLSTLHMQEIRPEIVVLDDKWQTTYGENRVDETKWPDLRGFIDRQHEQKVRVLLWYKAWDTESVPVEECITNHGGMPVAVDPTNPAFERRLRASVRHMLSPDGYDADGFKIDFTARIPSGPGFHIHEKIWGLELMKRYLSILYSEARQVKPDALIMTHTPHPYLADVVDMIRLNDIKNDFTIHYDINKAMLHRAKIAALACPEAIIDTDNWPITDKATWRSYVELQPSLGVPSLYFVTHIDSTQEALDSDDYQLIRQVWASRNGGR